MNESRSRDRAGYAARVLAAGRRDRPRDLTIRDAARAERRLTLPNLYEAGPVHRPPLTAHETDGAVIIRFNDSLEHAPFCWNRDSPIGGDLIHHPCWMEASMDDGSLFG